MVLDKYILIISAVFPPEPVVSAKIAMDLYHGLKEKGHAVKVLHPIATRPLGFDFTGQVSGLPVGDEITVESYTCAESKIIGRARESMSFGKECAKYIRQHYEEVKCVYLGLWPLFGQYLVAQACLKYQIPYIAPVQDVYPESLANKLPKMAAGFINAMFLPMDKIVLKQASHIHVISNRMKEYLAKTRDIEDGKFTVILNWQDESEFVEYKRNYMSSKESEKPFTFMYMGNIGPVAGVDLLIDAFTQAELNNAKLVVAGSGSMKERLKELAEPYKNIEFWDVPNGKVPEIQAKADCMLLPIKKGAASSSIPSKLPAYMFSAKPIIGCMDADSDTAKAIMESGGGWLIEPENAPKLADTMKRVVGMSEDLLKTMGNNAQEYGLEHFSKKKNLDKLTKVIIDCIKD